MGGQWRRLHRALTPEHEARAPEPARIHLTTFRYRTIIPA